MTDYDLQYREQRDHLILEPPSQTPLDFMQDLKGIFKGRDDLGHSMPPKDEITTLKFLFHNGIHVCKAVTWHAYTLFCKGTRQRD